MAAALVGPETLGDSMVSISSQRGVLVSHMLSPPPELFKTISAANETNNKESCQRCPRGDRY